MKDGASGGPPPGFLFHPPPPAREDSRGGLTPAPQASTASPAARILTAALISPSCRIPQLTHSHSRTPSGRLAAVRPQAEQVLLEGYQRAITTRSRPYHSHLYASMARSWRHAASEIARARWRLRTMFFTFRSSITTAWLSRTSRLVSLCRKSLRRSGIRACTRAALRRALSAFAVHSWCGPARRCPSASRARSRRSCRGLSIFSPVERVTRDVISASMPTTQWLAGSGSTAHWHSSDTNQRPAGSRLTVTVDGSAPSRSGRDHTTASGRVIFASCSWPSRYRNADRVYSAEARDFFRDLNLG